MAFDHPPANETPRCVRRHVEDAQGKIISNRHHAYTGIAQWFLREEVHGAPAHFVPGAAIRPSRDAHLSAFLKTLPSQHLHQLTLPVAGNTGKAENLAPLNFKRKTGKCPSPSIPDRRKLTH